MSHTLLQIPCVLPCNALDPACPGVHELRREKEQEGTGGCPELLLCTKHKSVRANFASMPFTGAPAYDPLSPLPCNFLSYCRIRGVVLERDPTGSGRATALRAAAIALCAHNAAGAPPPLALPLELLKQLVPTAAEDSAASVPRVDGDALWAPLEGMRVSLEYPLTVMSAERYEEQGTVVCERWTDMPPELLHNMIAAGWDSGTLLAPGWHSTL